MVEDFLEGISRIPGATITRPGSKVHSRHLCAKTPWTEVPDIPYVIEEADEFPRFRFKNVAICFHFLEQLDSQELEQIPETDPDRLVFGSMEPDVLLQHYRAIRPWRSGVVSEREPICIVFPRETKFVCEGRHGLLLRAENRLMLEGSATLSYSEFKRAPVRIWHLTVRPRGNTRFSEYDLISLMKLHEKDVQECSEESPRFELLNDRCRAQLDLRDLAKILSLGNVAFQGTPVATTLEFDTRDAEPKNFEWKKTFSHICRLWHPDPKERDSCEEQFDDTPRSSDLLTRGLRMWCGLVTGIFEFRGIVFAEMADTLRPTSYDSGSAAFLDRGRLISIATKDMIYERAYQIGISPYLVLTHAVILYNDSVVGMAEQKIRDALHNPERRVPLNFLEGVRKEVEYLLNEAFLPNVFHYAFEKSTHEEGLRQRNIPSRLERARMQLAELKERIKDQRHEAELDSQFALGFLLAFLTGASTFAVLQAVDKAVTEQHGALLPFIKTLLEKEQLEYQLLLTVLAAILLGILLFNTALGRRIIRWSRRQLERIK
jgi:hypothetical protein